MWLKQQPTTQGVATVDAAPSSKPWKNVVCPSCRAAVLKYQKLKDWWSSMRCWGLINYAGCEAWFKVTESLLWLSLPDIGAWVKDFFWLVQCFLLLFGASSAWVASRSCSLTHPPSGENIPHAKRDWMKARGHFLSTASGSAWLLP